MRVRGAALNLLRPGLCFALSLACTGPALAQEDCPAALASDFQSEAPACQLLDQGQLVSALGNGDVTYRLYQLGAVNPYGYVYEYRLPAEWYPKRGDNTVKVTLTKRDPNVDFTFQVYDIDCAINYRVHRHFESSPVDY